MKKKHFLWLFPVMLTMVCALLIGCSRSGRTDQTEQPGETTAHYEVYYTDVDGLSLTSVDYVPTATTFSDIVGELLVQFVRPSSADLVSLVPEHVSINRCSISNVSSLTVDFSSEYLSLSHVQEALLREGLVLTLLSIPSVDGVSITVDSQPLLLPDGTQMSALSEDSFITSGEEGNGINSTRKVDLDLYFADESGARIVRETRSKVFSSNVTIENLIVSEIIKGPETAGLLAVTSPDVAVNSVSIRDGTCVVDLNEAFNDEPSGNVTPEAALYCFVNSLCEGAQVSSVQFQINGSSDVRFRGQISLDQLFTRNADVIAAAREAQTQAQTEEAEAVTEAITQAQMSPADDHPEPMPAAEAQEQAQDYADPDGAGNGWQEPDQGTADYAGG